MAVPNISEIATATLEARSGKVRDNVSKNNAILFKLQEKAEDSVDGGHVIREELSFAENGNGQFYSGYDTLSVAANDVISSAEFNWKQYAVAVVMSGLEELQNSGEAAVFRLLAKRIEVAEATMANDLAVSLYSDGTGSGGKELTGLAALNSSSPTTGTYGGINRANYTFWRNQVNTVTITANNVLSEMLELYIACTRGTDKPNLIMAGSTVYQLFANALTPNQRFTDPKMADAGFEHLKFHGAPVVLDGGIGGACTATDFHFLNTKFIHWRPHSRRNMVPIGKKRVAINQDATVEILGFAGNLTCSGAQFQGRLVGA
jgi:hypothetical protein